MKTKAILSLAQGFIGQSNDQSSSSTTGISFAGGGFRAFASHTGLIAGLFNAGAQMEGVSMDDYSFSSLMENFEYVSSNSGGSWFSAQFVYSANFLQMMENMAAAGTDKDTAANVFSNDWTNGFLAFSNSSTISLNEQDDFEDFFEDIVGVNLDGSISSWIGILSDYIVDQRVSWTTFVNSILSACGGFDYSQALGAGTPNDWALGKHYVLASTLVLPPTTLATSGAFDQTCIKSTGKSVTESISYEYTGGSTLGDCSPIHYSTTLGNSPSDPSPFPFMYMPSNQSFSIEYSLLSKSTYFNLGKVKATSGPQGGGVLPGPGMYSNQIAIVDAVSSSSAVFSAAVSVENGFLGVALDDLDAWNAFLGLVVPVALSPNGTPSTMFSRGLSGITTSAGESCTDWFEAVQTDEILTVSDGAYVDNTGLSDILAAAQAGDSFTVVLDGSYLISEEDLSELFQGAALGISGADTHVPVFAQDQAYIRAAQDTFLNLTTVSGASQLLAVGYGTVAVTTADQPYFNVIGGIDLTLNVIILYSNQEVAPTNWADLGTLAGEISATLAMTENAQAVEYILNNFF